MKMPEKINSPSALNPTVGPAQADIRARRKEDVLSGAMHNAILHCANFSSFATDPKGVIQFFNVGAERMLGYAAAEVMNKLTPADLSDPQDIISRTQALSAELDTPIAPGFEALVFKASRGIEDIYELTYIRKDGSRLPLIVSVTALHDSHDATIGYLFIGTDNTAGQKAKQVLSESETRLNLALKMSRIGGWDLDLTDHTAHRTQEHARIFGTDPELQIWDYEIFLEHVLPEDRAEVDRSFRKARAAQTGWDFECRIRRHDGKVRWIWATGEHQLDATGKMRRMAGIVQDITERKQVEEERARLTQTLKDKNAELEIARIAAERANVAKSSFLSSMSHELRTPLNSILGFAQLIDSGSTQPTATQKRNLEQILKSGWHLLELINEILDLSLIESDKIKLSQEPVSLELIMLECQVMLECQADTHGVAMSFQKMEAPYFVEADRTRLKQVLINLIFNAIKYNKPGGTVAVECTLSRPGSIRINVRDTGLGMTPEQLAQLFQPFNRLGREAGAEEGTGIGLVVTKRLVDLMGGAIDVESQVGKGSVFWIELKQTDEPRLVPPAAEQTTVTPAQVQVDAPLHTLLYIEENLANVMLMEELIARRTDIRLLTAREGNAGIELARTYLPDVILMGVKLPDISGLQVLRTLAEDLATAHIPVVALSANAMLRDIEKGLEAGFFRYLTKPIKVNEFMETLETALKFAAEK